MIGWELVFAIAGLLAIAYLMGRIKGCWYKIWHGWHERFRK